jgi:transposase InsO family protein
MSTKGKSEYLGRIYERYQRAGREHKSRILDEFCAVCGYHRKAALRLLNRPRASRPKRRPGPRRVYDPAQVLGPLKTIWLSSEQPCSKRLKAALPLWLPHLRKGVSAVVRRQLLDLSPATIDRLLRPVRARHPRRGMGTTKPGSLLRHQVALRNGPANTVEPGHVEADTVAHCGDSTAGDYVYSLTVTDPASGWTENRAIWNKGAAGILEKFQEIERSLPFILKSFHSDNGSEFLNWPLHRELSQRERPVPFTRSRAYRKNDNAHVEQKNWTHVRQLFGHERFEHPQLVEAMNAIYRTEARLLQNYFLPSLKLRDKKKLGSRYQRRYEPAQTPAQRLLDSPTLPSPTKAALRAERAALNPFHLAEELERKLRLVFTIKSNLDREATMS